MNRITLLPSHRSRRRGFSFQTAGLRQIYEELIQAAEGGQITVHLDYLFADILEAFGFKPWFDLDLRGRDDQPGGFDGEAS
jgi:hypothetical protein